jgi:Protein of unknown function (DUF3987)/Toprim domain
MPQPSMIEIKRRLQENVLSFAQHYLSNGMRDGPHWKVGDILNTPAKEKGGGSVAFNLDGAHVGDWTDFNGDEHGDQLDVLEAQFGKENYLAEAKHFLGLNGSEPPQQRIAGPKEPAPAAERPDYKASAEEMWNKAEPLSGTPADRYLALTRGIEITPWPPIFRYAPAARFTAAEEKGKDGKRTGPEKFAPALVIRIDDGAGGFIGIQRVFLDPANPEKKHPDRANAKKSLGDVKGGSMHLTPAARVLCICEGPEKGAGLLAMGIANGFLEDWGAGIWAVAGAKNLPLLVLPAIVEEVWIFGDNDSVNHKGKRPGQEAAQKAADVFLEQGKRVKVIFPPKEGQDWDDLIKAFDLDLAAEMVRRLTEKASLLLPAAPEPVRSPVVSDERQAAEAISIPASVATRGDKEPGSSDTQSDHWPDPPDGAALHGLAGDFVGEVSPHSEADPAGLLMQFLCAFGNAVGHSAFFRAEADKHPMNLFMACVGETSKGRKGTSWGQVKAMIARADPGWETRISSGLSSGEGLIWQVRDPIEKSEPRKSKGRVVGYDQVIADEGVTDKRLMVCEGEFASVLKVARREGNTLSPVMRNAWDSGNLRTLTKNSPARASDAHISIVGHITKDELLRHLDDTEVANGFGNRFLWTCVRRSKLLPEGGKPDLAGIDKIVERIRNAIALARLAGELRRDEEAREIWLDVYENLSEGKPGLMGAMIARAEAQVMRIAGIYALLDRRSFIGRDHLLAALAVWHYCEASARFIFGERLGDPVADTIWAALRQAPEGLTRTDVTSLLGRHQRSSEIDRALAVLLTRRLVTRRSERTPGRSAERWFATSLA